MFAKDPLIKFLAFITFAAMIIVNALANILPLNNLTTGEISDSYPNLFAPAGITFSIWGIIYLLLGIYTLYQLTLNKVSREKQNFIRELNLYFIATSVINSIWIFAWHYKMIPLTVVLMLGLLISLIKIAGIINTAKLNLKEKLLIKVPFGIYFGWITIATIANITVLLVSIGWDGFGLPDSLWMIIILLVGAAISMWRTIIDKNIAYGLVPLWAYFGIWLRHTSPDGFNSLYRDVLTTVIVCMIFFLAVYAFMIKKRKLL